MLVGTADPDEVEIARVKRDWATLPSPISILVDSTAARALAARGLERIV
jgi:hypothetical protein